MPGVHNVSNALAALCAARAVRRFPARRGAGARQLQRHQATVRARGRCEWRDGIRRLRAQPRQDRGDLGDAARLPRTAARPVSTAWIWTAEADEGRLHRLLCGRICAMATYLVMPEPLYYGGTVERAVTSEDIVRGIAAGHRQAFAFPDRSALRRQAHRPGPTRRPHRHHGRARRYLGGIRLRPARQCWRRESRQSQARQIATGISAGRRHSYSLPAPCGDQRAGFWRGRRRQIAEP